MKPRTRNLLLLLLLSLTVCVYNFREDLGRFWFPEEPRFVLIFIRSETETEVIELDKAIKADVMAKNFDSLDQYFSQHQDDYFANGVRKRTSAYYWVFRTTNSLEELNTIISRTDEWIARNPRSLTARLIKVRAILEISNGYSERRFGDGEEWSEKRQECIARMTEVLDEAERSGFDRSRLCPSRITVSTMQGDFQSALRAFEIGRTTDKYSVELFDSIVRGADSMRGQNGIPVWYTLLDKITSYDDIRECYIYMRIVNGFRSHHREIPKEWKRKINWNKYYKGLEYTYATYPEKSQWKNYDALFSAFLGNYDRAKPLLVEIGPFANVEAWRHYEILIDARRRCGLTGGVVPN